MVEQTGEEIDWERCPPDIEDFPDSVLDSLNIFHSLGNKVYPEIGYVGKDYSNRDIFFELYDIKEEYQQDWTMELLLFLENETVNESQRQLKAEYDRMKKK
jgi:hypothetical protein